MGPGGAVLQSFDTVGAEPSDPLSDGLGRCVVAPCRLRVRQATVHLTQEGADIVRHVYLLAGTTALRDGPIQRCFRDIHAGSQHFFASPASTLDFARDLIVATPESALDA